MKKSITIFSIFLFLICSMTNITAIAETKISKQGIYTMKDLNLHENTPYTIQNLSNANKAFVIVFNSEQIIQQALRLKPQSQKYSLMPLDYDNIIVILGNADIVFS